MELKAKNKRARKIIAAIEALHNACFDAWGNDDDEALGEAYVLVTDGMNDTINNGNEIDGWQGGCLGHYDALKAGLEILMAYDSAEKAKRLEDDK